MIHYNN